MIFVPKWPSFDARKIPREFLLKILFLLMLAGKATVILPGEIDDKIAYKQRCFLSDFQLSL